MTPPNDEPEANDRDPIDPTEVTEYSPLAVEALPAQIGPYRAVSKLGSGGMGVVYLAEQLEPVRRRVALKLIKPGMDTGQVVARFEAERQALALMDHPGIARVLDAGATADGRPYFVMDFVRGISITEYCNRHRLLTRERLQLFVKVCEALQHAHQQGIIHRDIKPSNVLVELDRDEPLPRIIDFGVAKATNQNLTERTLMTVQGQMIGTPEYMSPEQADLSLLDVDTRSDIYSLGVLLYELLVGALPFDSRILRSVGHSEVQRLIREKEPLRPSRRLTTLGDKGRPDRLTLARELQGDLDWIVMKSIEKDRTRRYASASEFAADVRRFLNEEPVLACPPSTVYRLRKFVRRHRIAVIGVAAVFLVLVLGVVATTSQAVRATRAMNEAKVQRDEAVRQGAISKAVSNFLTQDLLLAVNPWANGSLADTGRETKLKDLLDMASERLHTKFASEPLIEASIRSALGVAYFGIGHYDPAEPLLTRAHKLFLEELGEEHSDTMWALFHLATVYHLQGQYHRVEPMLLKVLALRRRISGEQDPATLTVMDGLGSFYLWTARNEEAKPLFEKVLSGRRQILGHRHPLTLGTMQNLGELYRAVEHWEKAEQLCLEVLEERRRALEPGHPRLLEIMNLVGNLYADMDRHEEAQEMRLSVAESARRTLGNENPTTMLFLSNLALTYVQKKRFDLAEPLLREALETRRKILGREHPWTLSSLENLGEMYRRQGLFDKAEPLLAAAVDGAARSIPGFWYEGVFLNKYAECLTGLKRYPEAESALLRAHRILAKAIGAEHHRSVRVTRALVDLYEAWGRADMAKDWAAKLPAQTN